MGLLICMPLYPRIYKVQSLKYVSTHISPHAPKQEGMGNLPLHIYYKVGFWLH